MIGADIIHEYLENTQALLEQAPHFRVGVQRQIQARLLPKVAGVKAELEPALWKLLLFCLNGQVQDLEITETNLNLVQEAVAKAQNYEDNQDASFPEAAKATWQVLSTLQENGIYPPAKI